MTGWRGGGRATLWAVLLLLFAWLSFGSSSLASASASASTTAPAHAYDGLRHSAEFGHGWSANTVLEVVTAPDHMGAAELNRGRLDLGVAAEAGVETGAAGSGSVTVLGRYTGGVDAYVGKPGFNTLDLPFKGTGRWYWSRNKAFIDDAIERGDELRLVTNPNAPLYQGGNVYQRELRYLRDRGFTFQQADDYWLAVPGR